MHLPRIRFGLLGLLGLLGCSVALAQPGTGSLDDTPAIAAALAAEQRHEPRTALVHFQAAARLRPEDAWLQQKIAQQLSDAAFLEPDPQERIRLAVAALPHAQRAVELDPQSAVAWLSLAVLHGKLAVEGDVRTKIDHARRIKADAEVALELDPGYAWAWHVLGRWHVELSQIGRTKRTLVSLFFGGLPEASLAEGIRMLEKAVQLEPAAVSHHLELGFAYQQAGLKELARASWDRALQLPVVALYDDLAKRRARDALEGLARG